METQISWFQAPWKEARETEVNTESTESCLCISGLMAW